MTGYTGARIALWPAVIVSAMTLVAPAAPAAAARLCTGDYSTGDFSQWQYVQNQGYLGSGAGYAPPNYSALIVEDPVKGQVARFEVRPGDVPGFGGSERSEVEGGGNTGGAEGQTLWYAFSTRFDPSFPQNHADLGWELTNQWHSNAEIGSPPIGWYVDMRNGFWSLTVQKQSSPGVYRQVFSIFDVPLGTDWHDIKMQIHWSASDDNGWIRLWHNGQRQRFTNGDDTFHVRTLIPGESSVYYKEGLYRAPTTTSDIVYHSGFRCGTDESDL
ncbi:polysaccharide lyase [Mycobacterium sp. 155]|uniref:polysaccharide lyase n=1 Tax=Mycobacterium sp. 155 TaxID=1157943 RepID=UPI000370871C|nr:polysaccharide lyase [Mycobacterium sp. 155]